MEQITENQVIMQLKGIYDPEIPVNIYDMGMIYKIEILPDNYVKILMTLTSPNCPVAESLPSDVRASVLGIPGVNECWIELTFDPPWNTDMMTEEAKLELGFL